MSDTNFNLDTGRDEQTKKKKSKYMLLRITENLFAVPLGEVREVLGTQQITPLPNVPSFVAGMINLRGKIVTTIDLKLCLKGLSNIQAEKNHTKKRCIVITTIEGTLFGAIVDDVAEVLSVDESMIEGVSDNPEDKKLFKGIIKLGDGALSPIIDLSIALKIEEFKSATKKIAA